MEYDVRIVHEPSRNLVVRVLHTTADEVGPRIRPALEQVREYLVRRGAPPAGPAVAYAERVRDGVIVAVGFTVPRDLDGDGDVMPFQLPDTDVVTTTHIGSYQDLPYAYDALKRGAAAHGREVDEVGGMWEEDWTGQDAFPEQPRIEVFWPLKPR